ncbi:tRNA(Ile)-lysidine synthetase [hydrothermal vent metagenome]|uniref:tRNA(Ile)-lysidine synthetase n=1 Tax=hydrothermal vent metagenome TaxID=652676 RepID=A0A3B0VU18_9ZZZZ
MKTTDKVRRSIRDNSLLKRGDTVCVAVSGGVDSTVLLHLLYALRGELELQLVVCHLNHNLRGAEAARDRSFVKRLARRLGLVFESAKLLKKDIRARSGESLQEWARGRRLEFLNSCADKYGPSGTASRPARIALGHNMDDQCETVLMRLIKGASLRGLGGIAWKRERFIRPVLGLTRAEIEAFAAAGGIEFVEDSSNKTDKYLRNRIRHELMPVLEGYNPRVREAVERSARLLREDEDCLAGLAAAEFKKALVSPKPRSGKKPSQGTGRELVLDRAALLALEPSLFRRVFTAAVYSLSTEVEPSLYLPRIEAFRGLVKGRAPNTSLKLCQGLFAGRAYDKITVSVDAPRHINGRKGVTPARGVTPAGGMAPAGALPPAKGVTPPKGENLSGASEAGLNEEVVLPVPGKAAVNGVDAVVTAKTLKRAPAKPGAENVAYFDLDGLDGPLTLRTFRAGDRMRPVGMAGQKKLKDIFINGKVPARQRRETLLVLSRGVIIWACGLRRSGLAPVTGATKKVLKLTLKPRP